MRKLIAILALALATLACGPSTVNVLLATFHPDTVRLMRLPDTERVCAESLFSATRSALLSYKESKTPDKWQAVREAAAQFDVRQCSQNPDFISVVTLGQRILASVEPPRTRSWASQNAPPDFKRVDKEAVKELERKVEELKRR